MGRLAMGLVAVACCLFVQPGLACAQNAAKIFVYSPREIGVRSRFAILIDGTPVAKLKRGTFFAVATTEGRHMISSKKGVPLFVDLKPGHDAFVRLAMEVEVGEPSALVFDNVPLRVSSQEMRFVVYIDAKDALAASVAKVDPRAEPDTHFKQRESPPEN